MAIESRVLRTRRRENENKKVENYSAGIGFRDATLFRGALCSRFYSFSICQAKNIKKSPSLRTVRLQFLPLSIFFFFFNIGMEHETRELVRSHRKAGAVPILQA